ncbi:hypothetical protein [Desulfoluna spongiiphila]|uniref:hypothetical protein n=1 Tax=Desulfoluna spongiiphila TaxID=419481 RepID=UPI0012576406|nr:hypothetical protein [Desulfoluna spongiiphila]VVS94622.1 hypothetical protein DBB_41940 [Desulfoluna spongiiphila]
METFTAPRPLVANPDFPEQRRRALAGLTESMIDAPLRGIVADFNRLPCCFTLQCCYGHFLFSGRRDPENLVPLPAIPPVKTVEYRIAYLALCVDNTARGKQLIEALAVLPTLDPGNIQFGCADWFWERQVNSYALQVEPHRFRKEDKAVLPYGEALAIERTRDEVFRQLNMDLAGPVFL